jgi:hypothetical protein
MLLFFYMVWFLIRNQMTKKLTKKKFKNKCNIMITNAYLIHRATALETEIKNEKRVAFSKVTIWECYGKLVHTI